MDYKERHSAAMATAVLVPRLPVKSMAQYGERQAETGMSAMIQGLRTYMLGQRNVTGINTAEDAYTSEYVEDIARALIKLLSTEIGRLDGGLCDAAIREIMADQGFDVEAL